MSHTCRAALLCEVRGFVRSWCFRSDTGFTAIGGFSTGPSQHPSIRGVVFPSGTDLASLDKRERGYHRVQISLENISLVGCNRNCTCDCGANGSSRTCCGSSLLRRVQSLLENHGNGHCELEGIRPRVWVYLPDPEHVRPASADFPICQTYVDVVLSGCLVWGGEEMARTFCLTTEGWSRYWLNDATQSRRPWLHRKPKWREIDLVLESLGTLTCFADRKHSEEYAAACAAWKGELQQKREERNMSQREERNMSPRGMRGSSSLPDLANIVRENVPEEVRFHGLT